MLEVGKGTTSASRDVGIATGVGSTDVAACSVEFSVGAIDTVTLASDKTHVVGWARRIARGFAEQLDEPDRARRGRLD